MKLIYHVQYVTNTECNTRGIHIWIEKEISWQFSVFSWNNQLFESYMETHGIHAQKLGF